MAATPSSLDVKVYRDAEVVYMPHWLEDDKSTVIVNSAGGALPKPIVEPISIGIIHGIKWVDNYSDSDFKTQLNATNNASWRGWGAGEAWVSRILTEEEKVNDVDSIKIHYIIRCNEFGWNAHIADMGYFWNDGGDKTTFDEGIGLLDGAGGEVSAGGSGSDLDIQIKRRIDFATVLGF